jgi:hypothetical protein
VSEKYLRHIRNVVVAAFTFLGPADMTRTGDQNVGVGLGDEVYGFGTPVSLVTAGLVLVSGTAIRMLIRVPHAPAAHAPAGYGAGLSGVLSGSA